MVFSTHLLNIDLDVLLEVVPVQVQHEVVDKIEPEKRKI